MTYRPTDAQIVDVLTRCKKKLARPEDWRNGGFDRYVEEYICIALEFTDHRVGCWIGDNVITPRIEGQTSVRYWIEAKVPYAFVAMNHEQRCKALQTYRHQWVDLLIKEFS